MAADIAKHLLFGMLAFQNGLIEEGELLEAVRKWLNDKQRPLEAYLLASSKLSAEDRALLQAMVERHIQDHDGDASISIASVQAFDTVREQLENLDDKDISKTLDDVAATVASTEHRRYQSSAEEGPSGPATLGSRFRVLRPHRGGGLGFVSVGEDTEIRYRDDSGEHGREVALKQIREKHADDPVTRQRFRVEAEITGVLEHPNIVPVYGLGQDKTGRPFYAMRFVQGSSLQSAINKYHDDTDQPIAELDEQDGDSILRDPLARKRSRFRRLLEKLIDMCDAIHFAHTRGVLHRDLKPGNVMLGRYGEVFVVDWGLAIPRPSGKLTDESTMSSSMIPRSSSESTGARRGQAEGTPQYMSPEQASGNVEALGPETDVYALGAILYCMLAGKPPFDRGSDLHTTLSKIQTGDFPKLHSVMPDVSKPLEAVCAKAMSTLINHRYPSAADLSRDIQRWLDDEAVSAWQEPWTAAAARWIRHHQRLVYSIAAATVVALVAFAALWGTWVVLRQREQLAKEEALHNYYTARSAVDSFYTQVAEEGLLGQPAMEPKRKDLLQEAQKVYQEFATKYGNDAEAESARTSYRLGTIYHLLGDNDNSMKYLQAALPVQEKLHFQQSSDERLFDLANTLNALGNTLNALKKSNEAEKTFLRALELRRKLRDEPQNQRKLANTLMNLGVINMKNKQLEVSAKYLSESRAIREQFDQPSDYEWQIDWSNTLSNELRIGSARITPQTPADEMEKILKSAEAAGRQAIDKCTELLNQRDTKVLDIQATTNWYLARLFRQVNDKPAAMDAYKAGIGLFGELERLSPDVAGYAKNLGGISLELGNLAYETNNWPTARKSYELAVAKLMQPSGSHAGALKPLAKIQDRSNELDAASNNIRAAIAELQTLIDKGDESANLIQELVDAKAFEQKMLAKIGHRDGTTDQARQHLEVAIQQYEQMISDRKQAGKPESRDLEWQLNDCRTLKKAVLSQ